MATDLEQLKTIKTQILARIQEITATPKPNYNIDGQAVSWGTYLDQLWSKIEAIDKQIAANEIYEEVSRGVT